ncbi:hypothetical protein ACMGDM_01970 [Sphingomonas sp. DT-51]
MSDHRANADEGADPAKDVDQQNSGTTTEDLAAREGAEEEPDALDEDERD